MKFRPGDGTNKSAARLAIVTWRLYASNYRGLNWWDYTEFKRSSGKEVNGAVPIKP
jgi:hypothetical protein